MVDWNITKQENSLIQKIVARFIALAVLKYEIKQDPATNAMDLIAAHNDVVMDLGKLLGASDTDLLHDMFGIQKYMDRDTGKLDPCFKPRCIKKSEASKIIIALS